MLFTTCCLFEPEDLSNLSSLFALHVPQQILIVVSSLNGSYTRLVEFVQSLYDSPPRQLENALPPGDDFLATLLKFPQRTQRALELSCISRCTNLQQYLFASEYDLLTSRYRCSRGLQFLRSSNKDHALLLPIPRSASPKDWLLVFDLPWARIFKNLLKLRQLLACF